MLLLYLLFVPEHTQLSCFFQIQIGYEIIYYYSQEKYIAFYALILR